MPWRCPPAARSLSPQRPLAAHWSRGRRLMLLFLSDCCWPEITEAELAEIKKGCIFQQFFSHICIWSAAESFTLIKVWFNSLACILMLAAVKSSASSFQLFLPGIYIWIWYRRPYFKTCYAGQASINTGTRERRHLTTCERVEWRAEPPKQTPESLRKYHIKRMVTSMGEGLIAFIASNGFTNKNWLLFISNYFNFFQVFHYK